MANLMPKSVPYLVANEGAERFSYYGNNVILMVYMTGACIGMSEGEAAGWIHLFKGAVYFVPLFGALLADVFWGKYRTIFWLSLV
ncbi:MAG: MFS transporter, partial [Thermoguttaceae bacterium]|nr:MFS transporter [Thermoguttaceae bacterium]